MGDCNQTLSAASSLMFSTNLCPIKSSDHHFNKTIRMSHLNSRQSFTYPNGISPSMQQQREVLTTARQIENPLHKTDDVFHAEVSSEQQLSDMLMTEKRVRKLAALNAVSSTSGLTSVRKTSFETSVEMEKQWNVNAPEFVPRTAASDVVLQKLKHIVPIMVKSTNKLFLANSGLDGEFNNLRRECVLKNKLIAYDKKDMLSLYKQAQDKGMLLRPLYLSVEFNDSNGCFAPALWLQSVLNQPTSSTANMAGLRVMSPPMRQIVPKTTSAEASAFKSGNNGFIRKERVQFSASQKF